VSHALWDHSLPLRLRNYILINFSLAVCINEIIACYRARKIVARKNGRKSTGKKAFSRRRLTILGTVITHNYRPRLIFRHRELRKLISNNLYLHNQDSCALVCRPILIVVIFHAARIRCSTYQDGFCDCSRLFFWFLCFQSALISSRVITRGRKTSGRGEGEESCARNTSSAIRSVHSSKARIVIARP